MLDIRLQFIYYNGKYALHHMLEGTYEENRPICFSDTGAYQGQKDNNSIEIVISGVSKEKVL